MGGCNSDLFCNDPVDGTSSDKRQKIKDFRKKHSKNSGVFVVCTEMLCYNDWQIRFVNPINHRGELIMYRQKLLDKINEQKSVYEKALSGDFETVRYKKSYSEEWGISDENHTNRLRLAYYLMFNEIDNEDLTRRLFEYEVIDRETDDFQGIGDTLEILTVILKKLNADGKYNDLFKRAKSANFDCSLGYDAEDCSFDNHIDNYDINDCIWLAYDMDFKELQFELLEMYTETITEMTLSVCSQMIGYYSVGIGRDSEIEKYYLKSFEYNQKSDSQYVRFTAYISLLKFYVSVKKYHNACQVFHDAINDLTDEVITQLSDRDLMECGSDIVADMANIVNHISADADDRNDIRSIWAWVKRHLQSHEVLYGVLYEKAVKAAQAVNDPYADTLAEDYAKWRKKNMEEKLFELRLSDGWCDIRIHNSYELCCSDLWRADSPRLFLSALCRILNGESEQFVSFKGEPGVDIAKLSRDGENLTISVYDADIMDEFAVENDGKTLEKHCRRKLYETTVSVSAFVGEVIEAFQEYSAEEKRTEYEKLWDLFPEQDFENLKTLRGQINETF